MAPLKNQITRLNFSHIKEGPVFIENVISNCLEKENKVTEDKAQRYKLFINLLESGIALERRNKTLSLQFLSGYCYDQLTRITSDKDDNNVYLKEALNCFQYLIQRNSIKGEENYYIQLCAGYIMIQLGNPWPQVEELLLSAFETLPERGESIELIIKHYHSIREDKIAYIFSSFAKEKYFSHPPTTAKWLFNPRFYNWRVLDLHILICFCLRVLKKAYHVYSQLLQLTRQQPTFFREEEIQKIQAKTKLFEGMT